MWSLHCTGHNIYPKQQNKRSQTLYMNQERKSFGFPKGPIVIHRLFLNSFVYGTSSELLKAPCKEVQRIFGIAGFKPLECTCHGEVIKRLYKCIMDFKIKHFSLSFEKLQLPLPVKACKLCY